MATTGASLQPIYERLNGMKRHHPLGAETFADWSMEAGDTVKVTRDGKEYESPVHTSTMVWKGGAPRITVNSTGNEKRDPLTKVERRNFGRGGGGVRVAKKQYTFEVNQEHLWYEVMDENGKVSRLSVDVDGLNHEVFDADGHVSRLQNTVNGLHHEVYDKNGKVSVLENTTEGLYNEVYDPKTGMKTTLTTHAGAFSVICTGVTGTGKKAKLSTVAIQAGIDAKTNGSKLHLKADNIILDGDVVASSLATENLRVHSLTIDSFIQGAKGSDAEIVLPFARFDQLDIEDDWLTVNGYDMNISNITISGNVLTVYYTDGTSKTFSKATTLSGAWSGGTYTVTAKQNNIEVATNSTRLRALTINGSVSKNGKFVSRPYKVQYGPDDEHLYDTGYSQTVSIDATSVYNDGWDYGQTQRVRSTRNATSSELTIKSLSFGERWTILDTYTKSNGTTSEVKYTVQAPSVTKSNISMTRSRKTSEPTDADAQLTWISSNGWYLFEVTVAGVTKKYKIEVDVS